MQQRNPAAVFFLTLITFGIYGIVWLVKTKNELNRLGATIPTAWLIIVPFVSIYWLWKYSEGVEKVTVGQTSGVLAFVLLFLLGLIGMAIVQNEFNKLSGAPITAGTAPYAPAPSQSAAIPPPDNTFGGPINPGIPTPSPQVPPSVTPQQPPLASSDAPYPTNPVPTVSTDPTDPTQPPA